MSSTPSRAVILAAGRGSRLGSFTDAIPKPLMTLGASGGPTLIGRQLDQLEARGVQRVTVVVGYLGDVLRAQLAARRGPLRIATVENHDWSTTGSGWSLVQAAAAFTAGEGVLLTHGDVVYADSILDGVLAAAEGSASVVAADRSWRVETQDEVVAWTCEGRLAGVRKGRAHADADCPDGEDRSRGTGEFIGVSWFSAAFAEAFAAFVEARAGADGSLDYEQPMLSDFVAQSRHRALVAFSDDVDWRNVNDSADLSWARKRFAGDRDGGECA